MQKLIKREGRRKIVNYETTNPGDSHRPGEPQKITND